MSTAEDVDTGGHRQPRWPSSGPAAGMVVSATVVTLVIIATTAAFVTRHHATTTTSPASPPTTSAPNPASTGSAPQTGFAIPTTDPFGRRVDRPNNPDGQALAQVAPQHKPTDADWLTAAPTGTQGSGGWQRVHGADVPYSTSDGPQTTSDGTAGGWARTPQGAALAADWITWELNVQPGNFELRSRCVQETAQQLLAYENAARARHVPYRIPASDTGFAVATDAFRVQTYAPDLAVVDLALRFEPDPDGEPRWLSTQLAVVWVDGDWRLQTPAGDKPSETILTSLAGWTSW